MTLVKWLFEKLESLDNIITYLGFIRSKGFSELDLVINVKAKKVRHFISILGLQKLGAKGISIICYPVAKNDRIEGDLLFALQDCIGFSRPKHHWQVKTSRAYKRMDIPKLELSEGF